MPGLVRRLRLPLGRRHRSCRLEVLVPRRVPVVDDVPHMLGLLCRILGDALGSEAQVCAERDGRMALVRLALSHFDLVVTEPADAGRQRL